jgi:hypothetical protein
MNTIIISLMLIAILTFIFSTLYIIYFILEQLTQKAICNKKQK